jgi:hypothetical protein
MALTDEEKKERKRVCDKLYRERNKEKIKSYQKVYRLENKDKLLECHARHRSLNRDMIRRKNRIYMRNAYDKDKGRQYREDHKERIKKSKHKHSQKASDTLSDSYIKELICKGNTLTNKDIPQKLIVAKRALINAGRKIKEFQYEQTNQKSR